MKTKPRISISCLLGLVLVLSACAMPTVEPSTSVQSGGQPAVQAAPVENSMPTEEPTELPPPPTESASILNQETPTVIVISHQSQPGSPIYTQSMPGDCNTGFNYQVSYRVRPPCDVWGTNLLERAVSADMSSFYHYIDILSAQFGRSGDWYYASFDLFGAGTAADGATLTYYFELDLDQNGRGDVLLAVENLDLYSTEWSVTGVSAWRDLNGDVGGPTAIRPDNMSGNGYETLIFDQGIGDDPDMAWARHDPNRYQRIEFAFKPALVNGQESFMWWAGAMRGEFDPQAFDLVDSQSETMLYEIDTTCGWVLGYEKGYNVKKCFIAPSPTKAEKESDPGICVKPPAPSADSCWIWIADNCQWECFN